MEALGDKLPVGGEALLTFSLLWRSLVFPHIQLCFFAIWDTNKKISTLQIALCMLQCKHNLSRT